MALAWTAALLAAATGNGCGSPATSDVVEFCIPLEEGEPGDLPVARVVLDYRRFSAESRPTSGDTLRFLVSTEVALTTLDRSVVQAGTADASSVSQVNTEIAIVDAVSSLVVGRAAFWDVQALGLDLPPLGPRGEEQRYAGLLGGDLLRQYAVRFQMEADRRCKLPWLQDVVPTWPSITFFREIPDSDEELSSDGFGVVGFKAAGGGTAEIKDAQFDFPASRVAVSACVAPAPFDPTVYVTSLAEGIPLSGVDAEILVATGTQPLVMSQSFYERLVATRRSQDPSWSVSPTATSIFLPEGETFATRFSLRRFALVGNRSGDLRPCAELQRRRWIEYAERCRTDPLCPPLSSSETDASLKQRGATVLEVDVTRGTGATPAELPSYVVPDTTRLFEGLRAETAFQIPAVDLLVGSVFLRHFELLVDYPASRLVGRCVNYKVPTARKECDPDAPAGSGEKTCCLAESTLEAAGRSCCQTNAYHDADRGFRLPRSCRCAGTPCCQYFQIEPESK